MCVETSPPHAPHLLPIILEVAMPKDLLKDPTERDIVKDIAETDPYSWRQGEPRAPYLARKGIEGAYGIARTLLLDPIRSSAKIMERFRDRKLPQEMTEAERQQKLAEGPPTLGKAVGAVSELGTDVLSLSPGVGEEAVVGKALGIKALPFMIGSVPGTKKIIDLGLSGAVGGATKKFPQGRPVMEKLLEWANPKYEGRLWTRPTEGFPPSGAYAEYLIFKGQAPGTGMKVGGLGGELRFLKAMHPDPEVGRRIYNADPVLMQYMPKFHTMPRQGSQIMMTTQMKPISWESIKQLPLNEQREMFIKFAAHVKILGKRLKKHNIELGDMHMSNWGIKADGTPQIMDMGLVTKAIGPDEAVKSADNLMDKAIWNFDWKATPGVGNFDIAAGLADKLERGKITQVQLGRAGFWDDAAEAAGKEITDAPATIIQPPLSGHAPNDPEDIVKVMGGPVEGRIEGIRGADLSDTGLKQRIDFHEKNIDRPGARSRLESLQIEQARRVQRGGKGLTNDLDEFIQAHDAGAVPPPQQGQQVIPDPGTPSDSLMRELEAAGKGLDELEVLGPAGTDTRRRYGVETVEKKLTSDPSPSKVTTYSHAKQLFEMHTEKGNRGAAAFWKKHMGEIKRKQGWTGPSRTPPKKKKLDFPSGSPGSPKELDPSNIGQWSIKKLKGRIAAVERLAKDPQIKVAMGGRLKRLRDELLRRRRLQQRPRDITKEISK